MARAIDIRPIIEEIQSSLEIPSYSEHDDGFDDGLKYVLDLIEKAPTLTPPNEWVSAEDDSGLAGVVIRGTLADYEDTGLEPEEIIELKVRMEGLEK